MTSRLRKNWRNRRVALPIAAAVLLLIAVLMPDVRMTRAVPQVIVVLDVSQSMNTIDCRLDRTEAPVSRLACVKDALAYALREMPCGSQVAWGVFVGNQTYVLAAPVEVCAHRGDLIDSLAHLDWRVSWETGSRIGGALVSALRVLPTMVAENVPVPGLVFVTDGQEAPRLSANNRRRADDYAGKVHGVVVGVGGDTLTSMPKYDMDGNYLGLWQPDDVPQMDMSAYRAGSSVPGERMVGEDYEAPSGIEHLSSLKEDYLQLLARDAQLDYRRLARRDDMAEALRAQSVRRPLSIDTDLRWIPAGLALLLLFA